MAVIIDGGSGALDEITQTWVDAGKTAVPNGSNLVDANDLGTAAYAATGDFEAALGNPGTDNYILSSLADGTRSWVEQATGGGAALYTIVVDAAGGGDYTTISAALAAASAGDAIFIRNGTYDGGVTISLNNVRIVGESRAGVIIQSPLSSTAAITITGNNVTVERLTVDGRRASQSGSGSYNSFVGIYINGGQAPVIRGCLVKDTLGNGITGDGATTDPDDGVIELCEIRNPATDGGTPTTGAHLVGIQLINGTDRWRVANNYLTGWSQGIGLWFGAKDCVVTGNVLYANYGYADTGHTTTRSACEDYGSTAYTNHGNNVWSYNIIDGATSECIECAQGVIGSKFFGNVCRNANKFGDNTGFGIKIATGNATEPTMNVLFLGNTLYGDATATLRNYMYVTAYGAVQVIGNTFIDCRNTSNTGALIIDGSLTRGVFSANMFRNCAGGVYVTGSVSGQVITNNVISDLTASNLYGIHLAIGDEHVVTGNFINTTTGPGIFIAATSSRNIVSNNRVTSASFPVQVQGANNVIENNRLYATATVANGALKLSGASALRNVVKGNTIRSGDSWADIGVYSSADYNIIQGNYLLSGGNVYNPSGGTHNTLEPNHTATLAKATTMKALGAQTVGASQATIAHGLGYTPTEIQITMTSAGTMWRSAASDGTNIYLTADAAGRTAEVFVR